LELWRRREAHGSIRVQEGEPPSRPGVQSFLSSPVTLAMKVALSSHAAMICDAKALLDELSA
jgi:hypothetical protein